jgi:hypothetical protein
VKVTRWSLCSRRITLEAYPSHAKKCEPQSGRLPPLLTSKKKKVRVEGRRELKGEEKNKKRRRFARRGRRELKRRRENKKRRRFARRAEED